MSTLTLALPPGRPGPGTEFVYVVASDGGGVTGHGTAPLALLPRADTLVLVVPARSLSWHRLKLPPVPANRLRAALEGLLEERVLDDVAQLALAVGPIGQDADGILVAACDKAWLQAAIVFFEQAQRPPHRIAPELAPSADTPAGVRLVATGTEQEASLYAVHAHGVNAVPLDTTALASLAAEFASADVPLLAEPAVAEMTEQLLGRPVVMQTTAQRLLEASRNGWELAQFDLAISGGGRLARRWGQGLQQLLRSPEWRVARWGLAGLLLVHLVGLNAWAWRQEANMAARQAEIRAILTQTFPQVRTIVDAPLQMERELALLRQASGALAGSDMEVMLGALGAAVPSTSGASAIEFNQRELVVDGITPPAGDGLERLRGVLRDRGLAVVREGERLRIRVQGNTP